MYEISCVLGDWRRTALFRFDIVLLLYSDRLLPIGEQASPTAISNEFV
jgi:hypothetical protein